MHMIIDSSAGRLLDWSQLEDSLPMVDAQWHWFFQMVAMKIKNKYFWRVLSAFPENHLLQKLPATIGRVLIASIYYYNCELQGFRDLAIHKLMQ